MGSRGGFDGASARTLLRAQRRTPNQGTRWRAVELPVNLPAKGMEARWVQANGRKTGFCSPCELYLPIKKHGYLRRGHRVLGRVLVIRLSHRQAGIPQWWQDRRRGARGEETVCVRHTSESSSKP